MRLLKDPRDSPELQGLKVLVVLLVIPADLALRATQDNRASKDPEESKVIKGRIVQMHFALGRILIA